MSRAGWARGGKQAVILSEALVPSLNLAFEVKAMLNFGRTLGC